MAFQYPVEIPGVNNVYFLKAALNAIRKYRGEEELDAMEFMTLVAGAHEMARDGRFALESGRQRGLLRWREEAKRDFSDGGPRANPCDSGRDRFRTGHRRPEDRVAQGSTRCAVPDRAMLVVTHYQRLLNYIVPDVVHVLTEGRIVRSGGKGLALELEEKGYGWLEAGAGAVPARAN